MPIYTYRCDNCGVQFERQQHFSDMPLTRCPECGKKTLRKVYTPVGIVFKGSGFYATDNRSPSGSGRNSKTSETEKSEASDSISKDSTSKDNSSKENTSQESTTKAKVD